MKTVRRVGRVYVAFVEDAQGRRVTVADAAEHGAVESKVVLAANRDELRALINELRSLIGDLPPAPLPIAPSPKGDQ